MKIGILTLHYGLNYGGTLQAYATGEILRKMGHHPYYLDRLPNVLGKTKYILKRKIIYPFLHRDFSMFWRQYLRPISTPAFSSQNLHKIVQKAGLEAILVGSDQVWRKEIFDVNGDYFLGFCDGLPIRRVAFSASFGIDNWDRNESETLEVITQLKKFQKISIRENSGVTMLAERGIDATHIIDPVLIAGRDIFERFAQSPGRNNKGKIAAYFLDPHNVDAGILHELHNLESDIDHLLPMNMTERHRRFNKSSALSRTIPEWIRRIATADFVVTDSFHGTAFSILFNRNFAVLTNPERGNTRIESLLALTGLSERLCHNRKEFVEQAGRAIDFTSVNKIIAIEQNKAKQFLALSLEK